MKEHLHIKVNKIVLLYEIREINASIQIFSALKGTGVEMARQKLAEWLFDWFRKKRPGLGAYLGNIRLSGAKCLPVGIPDFYLSKGGKTEDDI